MEPLSREEAEDAADEIVNKIIGAASGLVPADIIPERLVGRAGFTKSRTLLIPDERIEDFTSQTSITSWKATSGRWLRKSN